ncbi:hypothetical protein GDO86_017907 [Hymenochirus boettgeri]|uniref:Scaffolding anchor of CK1 domain-containing protein n=1 Tax=Hymenochirus boettgeri TaxID=247094 RepID=A0A8T2IED5_9PIPI|nr:hypothetical protein GDO86_017907 [Hymenochirus boettgeri]
MSHNSDPLSQLPSRSVVLGTGMANESQCLDDVPFGGRRPTSPPDQYSETQRLAVEELVSGGPEALRCFLRRERVPSFLSDTEVGEILSCASVLPSGEDDNSLSASMDCSSVTYFPDRSDIEPPLLELGWPGFNTGSYRGATRVEVHFQPGYTGDTVYGCKEAARELIRSAREVIAVVMDSFTDNDIFRDIHEACRKRRVPVYILLDQAQIPHFLTMCYNLGISIETEQHMRVRTIVGNNYYTRSGAKIVGKVREKFLLVDGLKVATGNYSFTWTDGKLNSSNLLVLNGQIVEKFDLQFRILYAQSSPVSAKLMSAIRSRVMGVDKFSHISTASKKPKLSTLSQADLAKLSSTPKRQTEDAVRKDVVSMENLKSVEDDWLQNCDIISGLKEMQTAEAQTEPWEGNYIAGGTDVSTQTSIASVSAQTQTSVMSKMASTQTIVALRSVSTQTIEPSQSSTQVSSTVTSSAKLSSASSSSSLSSFSSASSTSTDSNCSIRSTDFSNSGMYQGGYPLRDYFKKLTKERQYHYTTIRSKLDHMVSILSKRNRLPAYLNHDPTCYGLQRRNVVHSSLLSLRDGGRFAPNM